MKIMLLKDVYKLGRAGEIKKVADGYGRNYLLPQGLAVMATPGAVKHAERIRKQAEKERTRLNEELGSLAERLQELKLAFPMKAGETGKLYGSVTSTMIAEAIEAETGVPIDKRDIDSEPIKSLGVHAAGIRLTIDLVPEVTILVHEEGQPPESAYEIEAEGVEAEEEVFAELREELEAEGDMLAEAGAEDEVLAEAGGEDEVLAEAEDEVLAEAGAEDEVLAEAEAEAVIESETADEADREEQA